MSTSSVILQTSASPLGDFKGSSLAPLLRKLFLEVSCVHNQHWRSPLATEIGCASRSVSAQAMALSRIPGQLRARQISKVFVENLIHICLEDHAAPLKLIHSPAHAPRENFTGTIPDLWIAHLTPLAATISPS